MTLTLYVDGERWRAHLRAGLADHPSLVPVIKGNGYGFTNGRLARRAAWLGVDTVAVGTYPEVADVSSRFDGSILVLSPWRPSQEAVYDDRVIHTVSRIDDLRTLTERGDRPRLVLERMTSMRRHGMTARELRAAARLLDRRVRVEGVALHLPMAGGHLAEVERLMTDVVAAGLPSRQVYVSHLTTAELGKLQAGYSDYDIRPRVGTGLWLGDRSVVSVRATVLDAHRVERGDVFGYRRRTAPKAGTILVVSGGTAHGIALEAPPAADGLRERVVTLAKGGLDAAGFVRSPYTIGGKHRLFAEPPHMQASMLFLPQGAPVPAVGDEVDVRVRFTTTHFDRILVS